MRNRNTILTCVGGGSNFMGLVAPFVGKSFKTKGKVLKLVVVESEASSKLARGVYDYNSRLGLPNLMVLSYHHRHADTISRWAKGVHGTSTSPLLSFVRHLGLVDVRGLS